MIAWAERADGLIFLALTAALMTLAAAGHAPGQAFTLIVLAVGVALLGLPHGSLDFLVAKRLMRSDAHSALLLFVTAYLLVAALYGFVWWWSAYVGLVSFLLISALHFGSDWEGRGLWPTRLAYGLAVVTMPALHHAAEVESIYGALGVSATEPLIHMSQSIALLALAVGLVAAARSPRRRDLFEFAGIAAGAILLPPLIYFGVYFCWLHSPRHLLRTARELGLRTPASIGRNAAAFTIAPVIVAFVFLIRHHGVPVSTELIRILFVGLAVLTLPHMGLSGLNELLHKARPQRMQPITGAQDLG